MSVQAISDDDELRFLNMLMIANSHPVLARYLGAKPGTYTLREMTLMQHESKGLIIRDSSSPSHWAIRDHRPGMRMLQLHNYFVPGNSRHMAAYRFAQQVIPA